MPSWPEQDPASLLLSAVCLHSALLTFQCTNGHLMCAGCFIHLLADARLKEEQATCPNCRCEISKSLCCRNLAVEKAVSELPSECGFCLRQFPRSLLERHQKEECQDRVTQCKYKRIGCPWQGPFHELTVHEAECTHPTKTGNELMEILDEMDQTHKREMQLYNSIFGLLSFEKIGYTESISLDIIPSRTQAKLEPHNNTGVCFLAKLKVSPPCPPLETPDEAKLAHRGAMPPSLCWENSIGLGHQRLF